jgi:hypothetical protein
MDSKGWQRLAYGGLLPRLEPFRCTQTSPPSPPIEVEPWLRAGAGYAGESPLTLRSHHVSAPQSPISSL